MALLIQLRKFQEEPILIFDNETGEKLLEIRLLEGRHSTKNNSNLAFYDPQKRLKIINPNAVKKMGLEFESHKQEKR